MYARFVRILAMMGENYRDQPIFCETTGWVSQKVLTKLVPSNMPAWSILNVESNGVVLTCHSSYERLSSIWNHYKFRGTTRLNGTPLVKSNWLSCTNNASKLRQLSTNETKMQRKRWNSQKHPSHPEGAPIPTVLWRHERRSIDKTM